MRQRFLLIALACALAFAAAAILADWGKGGFGSEAADYHLSQVEGRIVDSAECGDGVSLKLDSSEGEYWLSSDVLEKSVRFERGDSRIGSPSWADESGASLLAHAEEENLKVVLLFHRSADETAARKVESVSIYLF